MIQHTHFRYSELVRFINVNLHIPRGADEDLSLTNDLCFFTQYSATLTDTASDEIMTFH